MKNLSFSLALLLALVLVFPSCKNDDPCADGDCPDNEQEVITTIRLTFSNQDTAVVFTWKDTDGTGGTAPWIDTIRLAPSFTSYVVGVEVLDESKTPTDNITTEILEEKEAHQFFYRFTADSASSSTNLVFLYNDQDTNGHPIGLATQVSTGVAGTGSLRVTLLHEPVKSAPGVSSGDPTEAGGEADVDVYFPVIVQ